MKPNKHQQILILGFSNSLIINQNKENHKREGGLDT